MTEENKNFDLRELKKDSLEIDELFKKYPAPDPSPALVDDIKLRIHTEKQRINIPKVVLKTAAVAAVIVLAWSFVFEDFIRKNTDSSSVFSTSVFAKEDENINEFEKEINLLRNEFLSVCLNEESASGVLTDSVGNVEADIIETDTTFWKG
jgi:hypothetical protein